MKDTVVVAVVAAWQDINKAFFTVSTVGGLLSGGFPEQNISSVKLVLWVSTSMYSPAGEGCHLLGAELVAIAVGFSVVGGAHTPTLKVELVLTWFGV